MILRPDGTPYKLTGCMQQFNPFNPDMTLLDRYDEEIIRLGGSPIYYYEVFIQDQTIDPIYIEDRGKLWSNFPVTFYGVYEPPAQSSPSGVFGIDTPDEEIMIECNYNAVKKAVGHMPKRGSKIFTPHRQENWIIIDTKLDQFKMWGIFHLQLHCKKFQESTTTNEGDVTQPMPNFQIPPMTN